MQKCTFGKENDGSLGRGSVGGLGEGPTEGKIDGNYEISRPRRKVVGTRKTYLEILIGSEKGFERTKGGF